MNYYIIIPAYNEEAYIEFTLESILKQTLQPKKVIVVNDNSTDNTSEIISEFEKKSLIFKQVLKVSENLHLPGSKVIEAFNTGLSFLDGDYDFIVKLDADLILPNNYFEKIAETFQSDPKIGMVGGFAYIQKNENWILENLTDKDHIRGAFKAYRKSCFEQIGGLKPAMGWDTVDELLCRFYGWGIKTIPKLKIKHLKPTGANYNKTARYKQGEAFYSLGYGLLITSIAGLKLAFRKNKPLLFIDYIKGFLKAQKENKPLLVNFEQAKFIRNYRWMKIKQKMLG